MIFILPINVKMLTIGGIETFIHVSMMNTASKKFKASQILIFSITVFMSNRNSMLSLVEHEKSYLGWTRTIK